MENIKVISDSFGKMNGFLTFLILCFILISYLAIKFKEEISQLVKTISKREKRDIKDLVYHSMFFTADKVLDRIEKIDFTTFNGYDEVKDNLMKTLIQLKIETVKIRFGEFLLTKDLDKVQTNQLKLMIGAALSNIVNEYNDKAIEVMSKEMDIDVEDAKFLVDKYEEFREYIVKAFIDELGVIVMDDNYIDNFERINTILYTISISLSVIPRDVVATFNNINGKFKKYEKVL